jgi:hypothetical protein
MDRRYLTVYRILQYHALIEPVYYLMDRGYRTVYHYCTFLLTYLTCLCARLSIWLSYLFVSQRSRASRRHFFLKKNARYIHRDIDKYRPKYRYIMCVLVYLCETELNSFLALYMHIYVYMCMYIYIHIYMYICMYVYTYVCMYVCMYV